MFNKNIKRLNNLSLSGNFKQFVQFKNIFKDPDTVRGAWESQVLDLKAGNKDLTTGEIHGQQRQVIFQ